MRDMDDDALEWESIRTDKSRPPLRWIANLAGSIASSAILKVSFIEEDAMEEKSTFGFKYKFYGFIWDKLWPIYDRWGTFYTLKWEEEEE